VIYFKVVKKQKHIEAVDDLPAEIFEARNPWRLWALAMGAGVALLGGSTWYALQRTLTGVQLHAFRFVNDWPERLKPVFQVATIVPQALWIGVAAVVVTFLLKLYRLAWELAVATIGGAAAAFLLKHFIARPRPAELVHGVHLRAHETDMGFPSGHTAMITIVVLILFPYLPRGWRWLVVALIPVMMVTRVYLGVHSPVDVIAGFALGLCTVAFLRLLPMPVRRFLRLD
jgi:glycosyltransferase 2 family protein